MGAPKWSEHDLDVIQKHYPKGGATACAPLLERQRGGASIQMAAKRLGIRYNKHWRAQKLTPQLERELKHAYTIGERGRLKRLTYKHNVKMGWLKQQAASLGLVKNQKRHEWPPEADEIVRTHEGLGPKQTQRYLERAGFKYPLSCVASRLYYLGVSANRDDGMTANDIAKMLDVDHHVVSRWIRLGALKTRRRDNAKGQEYQKHWISHRAIRDFLVNYHSEWDMRRIRPAYQSLVIDLIKG